MDRSPILFSDRPVSICEAYNLCIIGEDVMGKTKSVPKSRRRSMFSADISLEYIESPGQRQRSLSDRFEKVLNSLQEGLSVSGRELVAYTVQPLQFVQGLGTIRGHFCQRAVREDAIHGHTFFFCQYAPLPSQLVIERLIELRLDLWRQDRRWLVDVDHKCIIRVQEMPAPFGDVQLGTFEVYREKPPMDKSVEYVQPLARRKLSVRHLAGRTDELMRLAPGFEREKLSENGGGLFCDVGI